MKRGLLLGIIIGWNLKPLLREICICLDAM